MGLFNSPPVLFLLLYFCVVIACLPKFIKGSSSLLSVHLQYRAASSLMFGEEINMRIKGEASI